MTFQRARVNFIDEIIENVQNRFPVSQGGVISAFSVLNFKESLAYSSSKWEGMLEVLLDHYGQDKGVCPALIDANKCKLELQVLVPLVRDNYSGLPFQELWGKIFDKYCEQFPELLKLAQIAMLLPFSTADCERGFSFQNRIKVKSRARISSLNVDQLMRVCINGNSYKDFDYCKALSKWRAKDRHIF